MDSVLCIIPSRLEITIIHNNVFKSLLLYPSLLRFPLGTLEKAIIPPSSTAETMYVCIQ